MEYTVVFQYWGGGTSSQVRGFSSAFSSQGVFYGNRVDQKRMANEDGGGGIKIFNI